MVAPRAEEYGLQKRTRGCEKRVRGFRSLRFRIWNLNYGVWSKDSAVMCIVKFIDNTKCFMSISVVAILVTAVAFVTRLLSRWPAEPSQQANTDFLLNDQAERS